MNAFDSNDLQRIKEAFIHRNLSEGVTPELRDLSVEFDIPYTVVSEHFRKEQWALKRLDAQSKWAMVLEQKQSEMFEEQAIDLVKKRAQLFTSSLKLVEEKITKVVEYLDAKLNANALAGKEAVMYLDLLLKLKVKVIEDIDEARKIGVEQDKNAHRFLDTLKEKATTIKALQAKNGGYGAKVDQELEDRFAALDKTRGVK